MPSAGRVAPAMLDEVAPKVPSSASVSMTVVPSEAISWSTESTFAFELRLVIVAA